MFCFDNFYTQNLSLEITSIKNKEKKLLKEIEYKNKHKDTTSLYLELNEITHFLKMSGYFLNSLDSIKKRNKGFTAYFSLNQKVDKAIVTINPDTSFLFKDLSSDSLHIPIEKISLTLSEISKKLDKQGKSFSKIQLKNITVRNKILFADLNIHQSKKRYLNKVIIRGYEKFPKKYIKNLFDINSKTVFNQSKITEVSNLLKSIPFAKEIKLPEVLFTKDSTFLYIYLKKKQNNSFDGIINFTSKEDGGVLFNGNIDLKFNNTLNKGEEFHLLWNSIGEERQEFKLKTEIPYIFNSKFTPKISFSIYRQDSTFLNVKFDSDLFYNINPKTQIALSYNSESSETLDQDSNESIETFNNYFFGFRFRYRISKNDVFLNDNLFLEINPTIGRRNTKQNSSNQFKIEVTASHIWNINDRNSFFIKNTSGYLNSNNYLDNELFRIGGANSIRGFNEQSIFTNNFTYFNVEYRYTTSDKSFFYTITDLGLINSKNLLGLGLGYALRNKNYLINIAVAAGKQNSKSLDINNSKFIVKWINFF